MYKYFFFDFDGMLADTYPHTATCLVKTLKQTRNKDYSYQEAYDQLKISYATAFTYFKMDKIEIELFIKTTDNLNELPKATLFLPIKKLLKTIQDNGYQSFIYTNRDELTFAYLEMFDIKKYFKDFIIKANKPDPTCLNEMIKKYNLDKKECLVVGDRDLDMHGAYNASIDCLLYDVDNRVEKKYATYVINHINQIYNYIDLSYHLLNNYHTHTARCGHATGKDEDYVIEAIKAGYQTLGFSDHFMFPEIERNYEYFSSIRKLKEKYKDQIDIKIALECEYIDKYIPLYKKFKEDGDVDYLIFGNHGFLKENGNTRADLISFIHPYDDVSYFDIYLDLLQKALDSNLFKYICHPDCFLKGYGKWDENTIEMAHKIGKLLQGKNIYAELSCSGIRSRKRIEFQNEMVPAYPFKAFFEILKEYDLKFVIGLDAHSEKQLDDEALQYALKIAKDLKLNLVYNIEDL